MAGKSTKSNVKKIEGETEYRKLVVRKKTIEAAREARAQGDLSESFEYYAAKKDRSENGSRIHYLEKILRTARIISDESRDDEVGFNNTVELYVEGDDGTETYRLATLIHGSSLNGLTNIGSSAGKATLRHKVGGRVEVRVNNNYSYYVIIKSIRNAEEDENGRIRSF